MQSSEAWVSEVLMQLMFVKHFEDRKLYVSTNVEEKNRPNYLLIKKVFSDLLMEM